MDVSGNPITTEEYWIETGMIAQEIKKIPELSYIVSGGDKYDINGNVIEKPYALKYNDIFCYSIQATQELDEKVLELEMKVESQDTLIQSLISRIEALENN